MNTNYDNINFKNKNKYPSQYNNILKESKKLDFNQLSNVDDCIILSTLVSSKINAKILELGTASGLATSWILKAMCTNSKLISVENNEILINIAKKYLQKDTRVEFILDDGENVIDNLEKESFDFIFADTWPGKYNHLEQTLNLLKIGGIYLIDDMKRQDNWPKGHEKKVEDLICYLENRDDFNICKINAFSGVVICTKLK